MSYQAIRYVKKLVAAPNGEKITPSEKLVLAFLADVHNMEVGAAWPSVGTLAEECCTSPRQIRRHLASAERKEVILRVACRRDCDGSQTSNEYVFLALSCSQPPRNQVEARRKWQSTPRSHMTGRTGQQHPAAPAISASRPRSKTSSSRGQERPPLEHLEEILGKVLSKKLIEQIPPTPLAGARTVEKIQHPLTEQRESPLKNLKLARKAWKDVLEAIEGALQTQQPSQLMGRPDCTANISVWQTFTSAKLVVDCIDESRAGDLIIKLKGGKLDVSAESFEPFQQMITIGLEKFYGRKIQFVWPGYKAVTADPVAS
jgi:hypothetical protein